MLWVAAQNTRRSNKGNSHLMMKHHILAGSIVAAESVGCTMLPVFNYKHQSYLVTILSHHKKKNFKAVNY